MRRPLWIFSLNHDLFVGLGVRMSAFGGQGEFRLHVGPIVDFLQHQKLEWREVVTPDGVLAQLPPPQPDLTMKGRTPAALLRLVRSTALLLEGRVMRHCVAAYAAACRRRQTSIWSMQLETRRGRRRVLTIELDPATRRIREARRKCNALPSTAERTVMAMWAERERLVIAGV